MVIPVAGLGTRSLPASKAVPKEMLPVCNKPIIQYIVEEAHASGSREVIFVSSKGKTALEDHFDIDPSIEATLQSRGRTELLEIVQRVSRLVSVQSVRQKEALGLGHAVLQARSMISSSHFFVMLGDEMMEASPTALEQLLQKKKNLPDDAAVIAVMKVKDEEVSRYGICELANSEAKVSRCIEKPKASDTSSRWAITGRYLLPRDVFKKLESVKPGAGGEIQLTDALQALAAEGRLYVHECQGLRFDAGDKLGFLRANLFYYLRSPEAAEVRSLLREFLNS